MTKGILFDFDGTLIDSSRDLANAVNMTREHYNLAKLSTELVVSYVGDGMRKLVERALTEPTINIDEAEALTRQFYAENASNETTFYPGAKEILETLKAAGLKVALTSNKPTNLCKIIVKDLEVDHLFDTVYGGSADYQLKPAPDMLYRAMDDLNLTADQCIMVGDNWTDIDSGITAGCKTAYYDQGFGKLKEGQANFTFSKFEELEDYLTELNILN